MIGDAHRSRHQQQRRRREPSRLVSVIDPYNGASKPTLYTYYQAGNLTRVTDPEGKATDYTYNGHNNLINQLSPDTGSTQFKYNAVGNVTAKLDAAGRCSVTSYDSLDRAATLKHFAASNTSTNTQTGCVATTAATYEANVAMPPAVAQTVNDRVNRTLDH